MVMCVAIANVILVWMSISASAVVPNACPNEALRVGPSTNLEDCRAYEMVSPLDKRGGDIQALAPAGGGALFSSFKQSSLTGEKVTYTSSTAFGDAVASPWANQYLSARGADGWSTHGISPPRGLSVFEGRMPLPPTNWETQSPFEAFTPDLCDAWLRDSNVVPLAPDGLKGYVNLYRRSNCGVEGYEALSKDEGGPFGPATVYLNDAGEIGTGLGPGPGLRFQGASDDLRHQVFVSGAALTPDEVGYVAKCTTTTGGVVAYQWLRNGVSIEGAILPTYTMTAADAGKAIQCQVTITNAKAGSTQVANPPRVVSPAPETPVPAAPATVAAPDASAPLTVGGAGGQTLTCNPLKAGTTKEGEPIEAKWGGSPSFSFQWYRNGAPLPGATSASYTVSATDLASPAVFQCAVTATNAGGSVIKVSQNRATEPTPTSPSPPGGNAGSPVVSNWEKTTRLYDLHEGRLELVSVLAGGQPDPQNSVAGTLGSAINNRESSVEHAVSDDGSRIFWTSVGGNSARGPGQIYVRIGGIETVSVSEDAEKLAGPTSRSLFWTAAANGSAALFSTGGFTAENLPRGAGLYEFDVDSETTRLVAGQVLGVLGAADDLSRIYFVSTEVLDEGAVAGQWNLYIEEGGTKTLIGVLSAADREVHETGLSSFRPAPLRRASRVSTDGRHLAFQALASLTGYENVDSTGKRYTEVFHYDADSKALTCVSCSSSGPPSGSPILVPYHAFGEELKDDAAFNNAYGEAASLPTWEREQHASRALSEDGNRIFFHSHEALAPGDVNGVKDVYQWEASGTGSCDQPGGCVSLISTGTSEQATEFVDASASGNDVFIATASSIDPRDESAVDIYDARVGGGFPIPLPPDECLGDECQRIPPAPNHPRATSPLFTGPENPRPRAGCKALARRAARLTRRARRTGDARVAKQAKQARKRARKCRRASRRG